jgi:integrase
MHIRQFLDRHKATPTIVNRCKRLFSTVWNHARGWGDAIEKFWFYDLRAKAADDTSDERGEQAASKLLGHESVKTTQRHYLRRGRIAPPTK